MVVLAPLGSLKRKLTPTPPLHPPPQLGPKQPSFPPPAAEAIPGFKLKGSAVGSAAPQLLRPTLRPPPPRCTSSSSSSKDDVDRGDARGSKIDTYMQPKPKDCGLGAAEEPFVATEKARPQLNRLPPTQAQRAEQVNSRIEQAILAESRGFFADGQGLRLGALIRSCQTCRDSDSDVD